MFRFNTSQNVSLSNRTSRIILGGAFCFAGLVYGSMGWEPFMDGYHSTTPRFKETVGTVIEPHGQTYDRRDPNHLIVPVIEFKAEEKHQDSSEHSNSTTPIIAYRTLHNKVYSNLFFGLDKRDVAQLNIPQYMPPGTRVKVWYDEKDPTHSVVVPGMAWGAMETNAFALSSIITGVVLGSCADDLSKVENMKKYKVRVGILGLALVMMAASMSIPSRLRKYVLQGTEEERRKRWVDPYIVVEKNNE
ncbi:hypothetical protein C9374_001846 [Naegleria lovaniensis]|uniref:DUF3592 domain-containing protein n=1 Tax=Naegleria lovaniensis TaxID=51637 RepID=A0AA88GVU8_NAELO|nr:uncharacterized protein C9374_001846 [Naegleria lovaniensis]KAG2386811.1 hypothetical protein C9374_001846 [Naegleria lovaniensis]